MGWNFPVADIQITILLGMFSFIFFTLIGLSFMVFKIVIFYGPKSNNVMKTFLPENLPAKIMRKIKIAADFPSTIGVRC